MFIAIYQGPPTLVLPNGTAISNNDCFLVVPGKGLVHIWDQTVLMGLDAIENGLPMKRIILSPVRFTQFWQLFTPRNDPGIKQPI